MTMQKYDSKVNSDIPAKSELSSSLRVFFGIRISLLENEAQMAKILKES